MLAVAAVGAGSVALAGFGIDSLIEILASTVVVWQLRGTDTTSRTRLALRIIAIAFALLALYIAVQSAVTLIVVDRPGRSVGGAVWLGVTAAAMFALAYRKAETGRRLANPVLLTEARITVIDGALAAAVLIGVLLNAALGCWWADPVSALVLVFYGGREAHHAVGGGTRARLRRLRCPTSASRRPRLEADLSAGASPSARCRSESLAAKARKSTPLLTLGDCTTPGAPAEITCTERSAGLPVDDATRQAHRRRDPWTAGRPPRSRLSRARTLTRGLLAGAAT